MLNPLQMARDMEEGPSRERLEEALRNATRARRLLENADMQWWLKRFRGAAEKGRTKLVYREMEPSLFNLQRGIIQCVEKAIKELEGMAANVEAIQLQLEGQYDRGKEPVTRPA